MDGTLEEVKGFCAVVTTEEIARQDYILTPGRYVGIEEQEADREPFEEKDGAADQGTVGVVPEVPRAGGSDQGATGGDWV